MRKVPLSHSPLPPKITVVRSAGSFGIVDVSFEAPASPEYTIVTPSPLRFNEGATQANITIDITDDQVTLKK